MATFNLYLNLIKPLVESLQADPKFRSLTIFYDRTSDRAVARDLMPAINVFLESPWEDIARGSGAYSLQSRRMRVRMGLAVWVYDSKDPARLDEALFQVSGDLFDWFRDHMDFDNRAGIIVAHDVPIRWDVDYSGDETNLVGTQRLVVEFDVISGTLTGS